MKNFIYILLGIAMVCCNGKKETDQLDTTAADSVATPKINQRLLIAPGKSIGNIALEQNADNLQAILGKPDLSDAAMGKAWLTWFSKVSDTVTGNELNIYTEYKDNELREKVVRQIRITSNEFKTKDGISTGKSLDEISKIFPGIKLIGRYDANTPYPVLVYDVLEQGIAFEAENNICTGIIIHRNGQRVSEEYITFHPDMLPM
jgi:hypothetical protein